MKNVSERIKKAASKAWHSQVWKYVMVCIIGVVVVGFFSETSVWGHVKNLHRINELTEDIERYQTAFRRDSVQIRELDKNPKAIEKIARERYFMKTDDEDIFVLSDDERAPKPLTIHETTE